MLLRRLRLTISGAAAVIALLAALLAFAIVPLARQIERENKQAEYQGVASELGGAIAGLQNRVPPHVSPSVWECAVRVTGDCQYNLCLRPELISINDLYQLRKDMLLKLRGSVDLETLEWNWDRLA